MKKNETILTCLAVFITLSMTPIAWAKGVGTSGGTTLLQAPGARAAALGETLNAVSNDITAFAYNPAALKSLSSGQASYLFQRGVADDFYSQLMVGIPRKQSAWGFSLGYYNGGNIKLFDGVTARDVNAKRDYLLSLGYARSMNNIAYGITGKYISSQLAETVSAHAFAADVGIQTALKSKYQVGAALQNIGTDLEYIEAKSKLPRIARLGGSMQIIPGSYATQLFVDAPYYMNEKELRLGLGLETLIGPLAVRAGYQTGDTFGGFSVGMGFVLGRISLDYSLGIIKDLNTDQRLSFNMKFGNETANKAAPESVPFSAQPRLGINSSKQFEFRELGGAVAPPRVYEVRPGDTLEKIALQYYGDARMWTKIFYANTQTLNSLSVNDMVGKKIMVP